MKDHIYVVNPLTKRTVTVSPTTFSELNLKERQDLQAWLINRPEVLGEPLLLVTSEFDKFDRSDRRLDLLLLDLAGTLVVAELKLDASGSLADQQAIRYAAFCSTMTMQDVVQLHARTAGMSIEDSTQTICDFLQVNDLPELSNEPRVLLAAGTFNDQELTSTVMWLRKFGVDISCVEITPYRYPGDDTNVLLIPKVLIPLAEARDYQISVERKERSEIQRAARSGFELFFEQVLSAFNELGSPLKAPAHPAKQDYQQLAIGHGQVHYEWLVRKRARYVDVAIHFEAPDVDVNFDRMNLLVESCPELETGIDYEFMKGAFGKRWAQICFRVPYDGDMPNSDVATQAARLMFTFVDRTLPSLRVLLNI